MNVIQASCLIWFLHLNGILDFFNFPFLSLIGTEELLQTPDRTLTIRYKVRSAATWASLHFFSNQSFLSRLQLCFTTRSRSAYMHVMPFSYPQPLGLDPVSFWPSSLGQSGPMIYPGSILPSTFLSFGQSLFCAQVVNVSLKSYHFDCISATSAKAWNRLESWRHLQCFDL